MVAAAAWLRSGVRRSGVARGDDREPTDEHAEGSLAGSRRCIAVGEYVGDRAAVPGAAQSDNKTGDVGLEPADAVAGDEMGEVVEVVVLSCGRRRCRGHASTIRPSRHHV